MPVIFTSNIEFDGYSYYINLHELAKIFPHIKENKDVELYLIEIRNEQNKLVKRFKPFKKLQLKTKTYWYASIQKLIPCLYLPEEIVSQFNLGKNYKVACIITKYDTKTFLPFEIKPVGYDAQKFLEFFTKIEVGLLSLYLDQPILNKAVSYLWDAYFRLEENDVEGARVSLRNSLDILKNEFLPKIKVSTEQESSEFPNNMNKLISDIRSFLHYGGPHPGVAPRSTTELFLSLTIELVRYLAMLLDTKIIFLKEGEA
jgi:hypothetical protein